MEIVFPRIRLVCLCMLLIVSISFSMTISVGASTTKLYVDPPKIEYWTPAFGETFKVNVSIANVSDLKSFEFKLYWNTTLLDLTKAEIRPFLNPLWIITKNEINEALGRYWLNITSIAPPPGKSGSGSLVTLSFKITHCEPVWPENATCILDLADTKLRNSNGGLIPHDVYDGQYWCYCTTPLSLTTTTDKPLHNINEIIRIYGNLSLNSSPVPAGLVALEVDSPLNQIVVIRTLTTGTPPANQTVEIISVIPCGGPPDYTPKTSFYRGTTAYFNVTVKNNGSESRRVLGAINIYDVGLTSLGISSFEGTVIGGSTASWIFTFPIPDTASIGNAWVYASALTGWPRNDGTAYCPEKPATFEIKGTSSAGTTTSLQQNLSSGSEGTYNLTFKLGPDERVGIYRVRTSASYQGQSAKCGVAFGVNAILVPNHYSTIQAAVNAASPTNKSILVMPGTYNDHVTINKPLTLVGRDPRPGRTIVKGSGTGTVFTVAAVNVTINGFTVQNSGSSSSDSGIALKNSSGVVISENTILKNYYGINIQLSNNNSIMDNRVSSNNYGIYLNRSTSNTLKHIDIICDKYNFGVFGDSISDFTNFVDTSNTVNRKPVIYWINRQNNEVPSNAGFVAVVSSTNIALRGLDLTKNVQGVLFAFTNGSTIERVNATNNKYGIYLAYSYSNTIIGSKVSNNSVGIYQRNSNTSIICHNNFINNTNQVERYQSSNTWDDGAGKGNHWSDYTGLDNGSGGRIAGDGVGDTLLPHQGVDWYPLMNPWTLVYDIAITSVTCATPYNASHVYAWPGWPITITVTVKNNGDSIETFNVSAYANTTLIQKQTVTLPVRSTTTITFTWNMNKDVAIGNYIISAKTTTVPGETYITDNTYIDGTVKVHIPGDAKEPFGVVNIIDVVYVALAFDAKRVANGTYWHTPPCPRCPHDPVTDINMDGTVNIVDLVIVALNWTK